MKVKITGRRLRGIDDEGDQVWALVGECSCGETILLEKFENRCGGCGKWYDKTGSEFQKRVTIGGERDDTQKSY